jgi:hypothetical protein
MLCCQINIQKHRTEEVMEFEIQFTPPAPFRERKKVGWG